MRSGALRHRIQILAAPVTQDAGGEPITADPTVLFECAAAIRAATSKEIYALGPGFTAQVTHAVTIRYPANLPPQGAQIRFRDRTFQLQTFSDPDERQRELDLMVLELGK